MAVAAPVQIGGYWVYLRDMIRAPYGSSHLNPSTYQIQNAWQFRTELIHIGYCETAIAGIMGNAQVESGLTPGAIQKSSVLPNGAERVEDVPNSYMLRYYNPPSGGSGYGLGMLQWDRLSGTYNTNDLLGWTNANGYEWYEGIGQAARLDFEFNHDSTYHFWRMNWGSLTWADFRDIETARPDYGPEDASDIWASCWELSSTSETGRRYRRENARYWYDLFSGAIGPGAIKVLMLNNMTKRKRGGTNVRIHV